MTMRRMDEPDNKELDRTNGALARMEAPLAGQFQRSPDIVITRKAPIAKEPTK